HHDRPQERRPVGTCIAQSRAQRENRGHQRLDQEAKRQRARQAARELIPGMRDELGGNHLWLGAMGRKTRSVSGSPTPPSAGRSGGSQAAALYPNGEAPTSRSSAGPDARR